MRYLTMWLAFIACTFASSAAAAQATHKKLALVIANSDYNLDGTNDTPLGTSEVLGYVGDLRNPHNDGTGMAGALDRLGFKVTFVENASREEMISALAQFGAQIGHAPRDAIVLFYYSGHAMQVNGANFLLPAGARIPRGQDISLLPAAQAETLIGAYAVSSNDVFFQLGARALGGLNLVILDSCRNNPWEGRVNGRSRSVASRGLAEQQPRLSRTLVAFSTAPGEIAADGREEKGANSPYTGALLQWIDEPGLTVLQMLNNVGLDVVAATGQIPWMNNAPVENICLAGGCEPRIAAATPTPLPDRARAPPAVAQPKPSPPRQDQVITAPSQPVVRVPDPVLRYVGQERYQASNRNWIRYRLDVANKTEFPAELFAASPNLPPCGTNTNSSRTWLNLFDQNGGRLYGFCALGSPDNLGSIWFALEEGKAPPNRVYAELTDRLRNIKYRSNLATVAVAPTLNPALSYLRQERYQASNRNWVRYRYDVSNKADFSADLFAAAPNLPPCGTNTNSSRTWLDFFDQGGTRLYGFCALGRPEDLGSIWFAVEEGKAPPDRVYVELTDRLNGVKYRSNLARTRP